ncbi:MAG: hypothetical protein AABX65_02625, partial [Nanoarchaeota archaeon]
MHIKGVGMTKFGVEDISTQEMVYEAALEALDDADMSIDDINAVVISNEDTRNNGERQRLVPSVIASILKVKMPMIRVPAVCGGGGAALWTALKLNYDNMLVVGVERLVANTTQNITDELLTGGERIYEQSEGLIFPAQNALVAQQHMLRYGTTTDDFALVALKNHENAFLNPKAGFYGKKVTLEQIKNSPIVADPLRLFDCSYNVNGAAACIITKDKTDIKIAGSGLHTDYLSAWEREDMVSWEAVKVAAKELKKIIETPIVSIATKAVSTVGVIGGTVATVAVVSSSYSFSEIFLIIIRS